MTGDRPLRQAAAAVIGAASAAGLLFLAWLLYRDRGKFWRPGGPLPEIDESPPAVQNCQRGRSSRGQSRVSRQISPHEQPAPQVPRQL